MSAGSGKKGPPRTDAPPPVLDPESFWSGDEENLDTDAFDDETTQPVVVAPPGIPARALEDDDIATVGLDEFIPPEVGSRSLRPKPKAPRPRTSSSSSITPFKPAMDRSREVFEEQEVVLIEETMGLKKAFLYIVVVALVFGFLGWFLVGRHAGQVPTAVHDELYSEQQVLEKDSEEPSKNIGQHKSEVSKKIETHDSGVEGTTENTTGKNTEPVAVLDEKVFIEVISDPRGAEVYVDGAKTGVAPTTIKGIKSQPLRLRLFLAGYKPWEKVLDFQTKVPKQLSITLEKKQYCVNGTGFLSISSSPSGARIEVNGDEVPGKTPIVVNDVCAGQPLQLTIKRPRYMTWKKTVTVNKGDILSVKAKLKKANP